MRELAQRNLHRSYLLPRLHAVLDACMQNNDLKATLNRVLTAGRYDPDRGRFEWKAARPDAALAKLRNLLDYCYYASDEFREKVT
jgi:hypothetical protein